MAFTNSQKKKLNLRFLNDLIVQLNEESSWCEKKRLVLSGIDICVDADKARCPICGAFLIVQKTSFRRIVTTQHHCLNGWWPTQRCPNGCRTADGNIYTRHNEEAKMLAMKNHGFGYDIEIEIGFMRYMKHMQVGEIASEYKGAGIKISKATISRYSHQFLDHLEKLHVLRLNGLAESMAANGGYCMHFDSTCEKGAGSLFHVISGWDNWIIGAWRQSTENTQEMLPHVIYLIEILGLPLGIMKDLSKQGQLVVEEIRNMYPDAEIRIFACHYHFVKDIGNDILGECHNRLKGYISDTKTTLGRYIRETRDKTTDGAEDISETLESWLSTSDSFDVPMVPNAIAIIRHLMQWVLDSGQDGDNNRFPFELPYLLFYDRAVRMAGITAKMLDNAEADTRSSIYSLLKRLNKTTTALMKNRTASDAAESLRSKNELFLRLRSSLQLEAKIKIEATCQTVKERIENIKKTKAQFENFIAELNEMRNSGKLDCNKQKAVDIILTHVGKYNDELWGHDIQVSDQDGNIVMRVADRTNNVCEQDFGKVKSDEHRASGRKNLGLNLFERPASASLVQNLSNEQYVKIVCDGSLHNLPRLFAQIDNESFPNLEEQWKRYREKAFTVFESGRLPRADQRIIRSEKFQTKIDSIESESA